MLRLSVACVRVCLASGSVWAMSYQRRQWVFVENSCDSVSDRPISMNQRTWADSSAKRVLRTQRLIQLNLHQNQKNMETKQAQTIHNELTFSYIYLFLIQRASHHILHFIKLIFGCAYIVWRYRGNESVCACTDYYFKFNKSNIWSFGVKHDNIDEKFFGKRNTTMS